MPFSSAKYDDNAVKIGNALLRSKLSSHDIHLAGLTPRGATALANGIAAASPRLTAISIQGQAPTLYHEKVLELLFQGVAANSYITTLNVVAPLANARPLCDVLSSSSSSAAACTQLQCLKLWTSATCQLQQDDIIMLGEAMSKNTTVQELWLGIDEQQQQQSTASYNANFFSCLARRSCRLTKLHVRGEGNPAAMITTPPMITRTDHGDAMDVDRIPLLRALQPLLLSTRNVPRELEIQNCSFPEDDWGYLAESLATAAAAAAAALPPTTTTTTTMQQYLASLSITNCVLTPTTVQRLSQGLCGPNNHGTTTLQTLRLCRNQLGDEGLQVLLSNGLLHHNTHLTTLALVNNQISDVGISYLAKHVQTTTTTTALPSSSSSLQHLDLMHNLIGPQGAQQLFDVVALHLSSSLQTLSLAENRRVGLEGISYLGATGVLSRLHVQSLDLSCRVTWPQPAAHPQSQSTSSSSISSTSQQLTTTGSIASFEQESCARREAAGQALVQGLQANYHLQELLLSDQAFSPSIRQQIAFYTYLNKCGRHGLLTQCAKRLGSEAIWSHVLAKCGNNNSNHNKINQSVMYYFLQQKPELMARASSMSSRQ